MLRWELDEGLETRAQRIQLSVLRTDFAGAPHVLEEPVEPGVREHRFRAPLFDATVYYWRIFVLAEGEQPAVFTEPRSFLTPGCPGADYPGD